MDQFAKEVEDFCNSINPASVSPVFCFPMGEGKIMAQWQEEDAAPIPPTSALALALMLGNMKNETCGINDANDELLEMDILKGYDLCVKNVLSLLPQIKDGAKEIAEFLKKSKEDFIDYHIKQKQSSLDTDNVLKLAESTAIYKKQLNKGYDIAISALKCTIEKQLQRKWGEIMNS